MNPAGLAARELYAMGTCWSLSCDRPALLPAAERLIRHVEATLSRFSASSALSQLNRQRELEHPLLAEVVRRALAAGRATGGAFDARLGLTLRSLGYDRDFHELASYDLDVQPAVLPRLDVYVEGDRVVLIGHGELDLGGIAKGWTVDQVHRTLREGGAAEILVDGGGDLHASGGDPWIGTPDGGAFLLRDGAVATSSTVSRTWRARSAPDQELHPMHHLLDPITGTPTDTGLRVATVRARSALWAEVWAKAVLVRPALLTRLVARGVPALVQSNDGLYWMTPAWETT